MTIDIIDLTDPEFSNLTSLQLSMVYAAQREKDSLVAAGEREKRALFYRMLKAHVVRSAVRTYEEERLDGETARKVDVVREDLIRQLRYESLQNDGNEAGKYSYPANPNYSLTPAQRFIVVREYYMTEVSDPVTRLQAYSIDTLARSYLGEYYQTLYDLLASYC